MSDNWASTFYRRLKILFIIPEDIYYTSKKISQLLSQWQRIEIGHRTLERDLEKLVRPIDNCETDSDYISCFPIEKHRFKEIPEDGCRFGYRWIKGQKQRVLSNMDQGGALVFSMLNRYLDKTIPVPVRNIMQPYFTEAENILSQDNAKKFREWRNNIIIEQRGMPLEAANYPENLLETIHYALYNRKQLAIRYYDQDSKSILNAVVHPLGMVIKEPKMYLVLKNRATGTIETQSMIRIQQADIVYQKALWPKDFNIRLYLPHYRSNEAIDLNLLIHNSEIADNLRHNPIETLDGKLSIAEVPGEGANRRYQIKCQVADTHFLRQWLLALGSSVTVISPKSLRDEMVTIFTEALRNYAL